MEQFYIHYITSPSLRIFTAKSHKFYLIVLYHNTRLFNPDTIREKGLIFSDERYIDSLIKMYPFLNHVSCYIHSFKLTKPIKQYRKFNHIRFPNSHYILIPC